MGFAIGGITRRVAEFLAHQPVGDPLVLSVEAARHRGQLSGLEGLLRRGLEDESAAARGSALIALTTLSSDHPGDVNPYRPLLNELAMRDPNSAVRRLAIACLRNGTPDRGTIQLLEGIAQDDEAGRDVREAARAVAAALLKKSRTN